MQLYVSTDIAAYNVLGAWLGGLTIAAGPGYTSPLWMGALPAAVSTGPMGIRDRAKAQARHREGGALPVA